MKRSSIQAINRDVVHQICSGQVVLNLATAVKELVENSLDAGATVVEVRLREYGSELVEVIDNGLGVEEENFEGLTLKHHTSKLKEFSDLVSVETFGFRGEALSSLCALSEMIITTRHATASHGTRLEFDYRGHIVKRTPCARQIGTTVTLQNIFGTLPVRHKEFHRNLRREFSKMSQLLYAYCLVSTGTKITCINQNKKGGRTVVVSTQGSESVRENIACVFGAKQVQCLMDLDQKPPSESILQESGLPTEISSSETTFQLEGYISSCAHGQGRSAADRQFYYVNSRPCEPSKVTKVVNEVYHQFNQHQYPFVFLNLKMARDAVDVNVTPDKRQIFLEQEKLLIATIKASLLQLYETIPSTFHFQNIPTNFPAQISSPPTPTSTPSSPASGSLTDRFKQWSHSRASVSTSPTSGKGVKRVSEFAKQEENKKSK
ncbi:Mismatch repair endonuclease PMS2 [Blattella germanica]|nr:Mismatch repair endonuclease PMS2 [Blattella germanica]